MTVMNPEPGAAGAANGSFYPGDIPSKPGVYVFRDRFGTIIYVGKAADLRKRMSQYFQPSRNRTGDPKLRSLLHSIARWEYYTVRNEDEALLLESRFIKEYAPRYNVLMRDDKRFLLVKIDLNAEFPRLTLARLKKDDQSRYFGPFPKGTALRDTVTFLNRHFGLRVCRADIPGEEERRHCLAGVIRDCCAPCIGKISRDGYREMINGMMKILEGDIEELTAEIRKQMEDAAAKQQFEKAAKWRDVITNLETIFGAKNRTFRFAAIPAMTGDLAVTDLQEALGLSAAPERIEAFDVSNIGGKLAVASMVCFIGGKPSKKDYRRFRIREVEQSDDFAMMGEAVRRHFSRLIREEHPLPDLLLLDGGKGQLSTVLHVLVEIGCPPLPVVALAKKQEELFLPGRSESIVLDRHRPALRLVQAIRDEAHRFAVSYHRELRSRRLQESMLDEIPGIGKARKLALLRAFGSVRELRKATASEIAERVPGIGTVFAENLVRLLRKGP